MPTPEPNSKPPSASRPSGPIAADVAPEFDGPTILNELITLFDGPQQREAQRLSVEALAARGDPRPKRELQRRDHPRCEGAE